MAAQPIHCICEGSSDEAFLKNLCKARRLDEIKVREWPGRLTRGITGFREILGGMPVESGIEQCKLVVVIADNDGAPSSRFAEIQNEIRLTELFGIPNKPRQIAKPLTIHGDQHIPDITILMLPWDLVEGNLETILYEAGRLHNRVLAECVEQFSKCVTAHKGNKWDVAKVAKLKARCLLSASAIKNPDVSMTGAWRTDNGDPFPLKSKGFNQIASYLKRLLKKYPA